ncbi:glycoside hydrolase family 43 protein [Cellulomonas sp. ICMP 17802]|uniref:glycoside hydrolase family 43 protein n=1 Tax=Cellulomonas sp. ICMP 17802 TaxID=3239199 RepID=UPI00351AD939
MLLNPAVSGFHPDPSVVRVGDDYYLACSSFEYFPGVPLFHSTDAEHWTPIGHVVTRPGQLAIEDVPTGGGAWAPTIRFHDGQFWLTVADAMGRGGLIFTATDPAGEWSDGVVMVGADGIDHDITWDADGTCYVTYSGLLLTGPEFGTHLGIQQVRMDPTTGQALEAPRSLWSGTGLKFPEAPHLYEIDGTWYLMIAEGGTERGHGVSIARGPSPEGPFEGAPVNPVYSHRSTSHPVQNAGHGDLVHTDDGWRMVLLGTRPGGMSQMFAPLGRETFTTRVAWVDGWPVVERFTLTPDLPPVETTTSFAEPLGLEWLSIRDAERGWLARSDGRLVITAPDDAPPVAMDAHRPHFLGRRQLHLGSRCAVRVDASSGTGGLSVRYDERHHYDVEVSGGRLVARVRLDQLEQTWEAAVPDGPVELWISTTPVVPGPGLDMPDLATCDLVRLGYGSGADAVELAVVDGRYLTSDVTSSFTGRVTGMYAASGTVAFEGFEYAGHDA